MKKLFTALLALTLIFGLAATAFAADALSKKTLNPDFPDCPLISDADYYPENYIGYVYPVRPGKTEWISVADDHMEMIKSCQIPSAVLEAMSTEQLVQSMLSYPLAIDILAYDSVFEGFDIVARYSNGISELINREQAGLYLLDAFEAQNLVDPNELDQSSVEAFRSDGEIDISSPVGYRAVMQMFRNLITEIFLAQPAFMETLTEPEITRLSAAITRKEQEKSALDPEFYASSDLSDILGGAVTRASGTWNGYDITYTIAPPFTASGVTVSDAFDVSNELTSAQKTYLNTIWGVAHITAIRFADPSLKYNCHSYAWHKTSGQYIINYRATFGTTNYSSANKDQSASYVVGKSRITYKENGSISHSGIISSVNTSDLQKSKVKSKWAHAGAYEHPIKACPYWVDWASITIYKQK